MALVDEYEAYFRGEALYGDGLSREEIEAWYEDEREGYANLGAKERETYSYSYHALNRLHCFGRLPERRFESVLGFGSAYGDELEPIAASIEAITIIDPSDAFTSTEIFGVPVRYVKPAMSGDLPFADNSFDLICCFGVLHHVPNVSHVIKEFARVVRPGGYVALREPIVSMGDWRNPRGGLTKNERGIPHALMRKFVTDSGLLMEYASFCDFALTPRLLGPLINGPVYNNNFAARLDKFIANALAWKNCYHARSNLDRIRPASLAVVSRKP